MSSTIGSAALRTFAASSVNSIPLLVKNDIPSSGSYLATLIASPKSSSPVASLNAVDTARIGGKNTEDTSTANLTASIRLSSLSGGIFTAAIV